MRILSADVGNTRTKMVLWDGGVRTDWDGGPVNAAMASVTGTTPDWRQMLPGVEMEMLTSQTALPISIDYATPTTLGADRKAAACGAWALARGRNCLIVDAGTCVTVDLLTADGTFRGGAILPGVKMKFEALHTFTARLPLLDNDNLSFPSNELTGRSTEESMAVGVVTATRIEIEGLIARYQRQYEHLEVIATGGDAARLMPEGTRIEPDLVLIGLREIVEWNHSGMKN